MLTRDELVGLYRDLRDARVMSVYMEGGQTDAAARIVSSRALERGFDNERRRLSESAPPELEDFDAARAALRSELDRHKAFLPDRGWVGFATADKTWYAEGLPVPMPNLVRWESGIRVAPYVRVLKQDRVVVTAVADSRRARLFTYRDGAVVEHDELTADRDFGEVSESTASKRARSQSGVRGETGTDAGQRLLDRSATRLQAELVARLTDLAGHDGFVILGGTPEVVSALARECEHFGDRLLERPSMHLDLSEAEVKAATEEAASELTRHQQEALLADVIDAARSRGRGCLGIQATREALREGRVDMLLITRGMRARDADLADHFVGTAFEHGASVEELSGSGAERLDSEGEGVGGRLRYTV